MTMFRALLLIGPPVLGALLTAALNVADVVPTVAVAALVLFAGAAGGFVGWYYEHLPQLRMTSPAHRRGQAPLARH